MAVTAEQQTERARLRNLLMHSTAELWIVTVDGTRWLTDKYTLIALAEGEALADDGTPLPDGPYKLTLTHGFEPGDPERVAPDIAGYLEDMLSEEPRWLPCSPTQWSIAESGAKAMLVFAYDGDTRYPVLINEEVWTAYHDEYDRNPKSDTSVLFEKDPARPGRPFRISTVCLSSVCAGDEEIEVEETRELGYVMGAKMPNEKWGKQDAEKVAQYIVDEAA